MYITEIEMPENFGTEGALTAVNLEEFANTMAMTPVTTDEDPSVHAPAPTFSVGAAALAGVSWEFIRNIVGKFVWNWYDLHLEDTVVKFKIKLIVIPLRVTVKVKDCGWLLRALFGDRNTNTSVPSGSGNRNSIIIG